MSYSPYLLLSWGDNFAEALYYRSHRPRPKAKRKMQCVYRQTECNRYNAKVKTRIPSPTGFTTRMFICKSIDWNRTWKLKIWSRFGQY